MINIKDKNTDLLFIADIFHAYEIQMKYPNTAVIYDTNKDMAVKSRIKVMNKSKGTNTLIVGSHTPFYKPVTWK